MSHLSDVVNCQHGSVHYTAFALETLVFGRQVWAKISVGFVFAVGMLLISWFVGATMAGQTDFSVFGTIYNLKHRLLQFTRGLRGEAVGSLPDAVHRESDVLEGIFSFIRQWRESTFPAQVVRDDQIGGNA